METQHLDPSDKHVQMNITAKESLIPYDQLEEMYERTLRDYSRLKAENLLLKRTSYKEIENQKDLKSLLKFKEFQLQKTKEQMDLLEFQNDKMRKQLGILQGELKRSTSGWLGYLNIGRDERQAPEIEVLEQELQNRISQNENLHRQLELNKLAYENQINEIEEEKRELESQIVKLKSEVLDLMSEQEDLMVQSRTNSISNHPNTNEKIVESSPSDHADVGEHVQMGESFDIIKEELRKNKALSDKYKDKCEELEEYVSDLKEDLSKCVDEISKLQKMICDKDNELKNIVMRPEIDMKEEEVQTEILEQKLAKSDDNLATTTQDVDPLESAETANNLKSDKSHENFDTVSNYELLERIRYLENQLFVMSTRLAAS